MHQLKEEIIKAKKEIASDTAFEQLNSNYLRNILLKEIKMYSVFTFRYKIIPTIMKTLNETMKKN